MKVLIADKLSPQVKLSLEQMGCTVVTDVSLKDDTLTEKIREIDPEVVIVRSTKMLAPQVEAGNGLQLIIRAGAGVNTIDLKACCASGIYVANCPGKNAAAVAELAIGHLINLDRRLADNVAMLRQHKWDKKTFGVAKGLRGRTLAVLGTGQIGRLVIERAQALGMKIIGWDIILTPELAANMGIERADTAEEAVAKADAVTVHIPLLPVTKGLIGASVFNAMKPNSFFINTSRGEIIDQGALVDAIKTKNIRAGLDVYAKEPAAAQGTFEDPIADLPNVYGTHHIGASTEEAEEAVGEETLRIVEAFLKKRAIPNCVNVAEKTEATHALVVRHKDTVGVLATILHTLSEAKLNVEDMNNLVFTGSEAACARISVIGEPTPQVIKRIRENPNVFFVSASPM